MNGNNNVGRRSSASSVDPWCPVLADPTAAHSSARCTSLAALLYRSAVAFFGALARARPDCATALLSSALCGVQADGLSGCCCHCLLFLLPACLLTTTPLSLTCPLLPLTPYNVLRQRCTIQFDVHPADLPSKGASWVRYTTW